MRLRFAPKKGVELLLRGIGMSILVRSQSGDAPIIPNAAMNPRATAMAPSPLGRNAGTVAGELGVQ